MKILVIGALLSTVFEVVSSDTRSLYPIKECLNEMIGIMKQDEDYKTFFSLLNPQTGQEEFILWSAYNPLFVDFSPSEDEICFLDNGRIRVHALNKRSAQLLELSRPLVDCRFVRWFDKNHWYCIALSDKRYGVYLIDRQGTVQTLLACDDGDYLDAHTVDGWLVGLRRRKSGTEVVCFVQNGADDFRETVIYKTPIQLLFVRMESRTAGIVMSEPELVYEKNKAIFDCYRLQVDEAGHWNLSELFQFMAPLDMVQEIGSNRLSESMLPLVPHFYNGYYYYATCTDTNPFLSIFRCSVTGRTKELLVLGQGEHCFSPLLAKDVLWYGVLINNRLTERSA